MTTEQKIIRANVGVLELAKQLGNVSKACQLMVAGTASIASKNSMRRAARRHCRRSRDRNRC